MRMKHTGDNSELSKLYRKFFSVFTRQCQREFHGGWGDCEGVSAALSAL